MQQFQLLWAHRSFLLRELSPRDFIIRSCLCSYVTAAMTLLVVCFLTSRFYDSYILFCIGKNKHSSSKPTENRKKRINKIRQESNFNSTNWKFFRCRMQRKRAWRHAIDKHTVSRFTCPKIAVHFTGSFQAVFFFADSKRKNSFQPVKNLCFCISQQKKEPLEKNRYFGTCKPAKC